ncbi:RibD family protein [Leptolyngbya sp. PL-A3]|nr:RibD family protein [Leptolyngbya sp. FACHB-8]MBD2158468.1 RibD family protein [Leptolyngbya sp. FACHB-16]
MNPGSRPYITLVLAMSADGKIADRGRSPARFGSEADRAHLEQCIAEADGVMFGAGTVRAYGTTLPVRNPVLLEQRQQRQLSPQPVHIVCSRSGQLDPGLRFFQQPVPRWLLTTPIGATSWAEGDAFEHILTVPEQDGRLNWTIALPNLRDAGLHRLVLGGGGELVAALLAVDAIDELWLTVCPLLLGGTQAPSPVDGAGFPAALAPRLELISSEAIGQEVFLHYRLRRE